MKKNYIAIGKNCFFFTLFFAFCGNAFAQKDSTSHLRTGSTESISGNVTYDGSGAGTTGDEGTYVGYNSGRITTGKWNSFFGARSGYSNTTGDRNILIGGASGYNNTTGRFNTFTGYGSGYSNTSGSSNVFMGLSAGNDNTTGSYNTYLGFGASNYNTSGINNVSVGYLSGNSNVTGAGNIFIGYKAGYNEMGSNKLYIANSDTISPLLYGDFALKKLVLNGKVGIGTANVPNTIGSTNISAYKLYVKGGILTDEIRVRSGWADYVFDKNYKLNALTDVEEFIKRNGHLPNVPSTKNILTNGLSLGDIARIQQEKIEELTLYIIEQNKDIEAQNVKHSQLKVEVDNLKLAILKLLDSNK